MRWLTNFYDFRFKGKATAAIGIHPAKAWLSQLVNLKNAIWMLGHLRRTICNMLRRELGEYSADGGDQAGFGVVGGHVGDVLDVWPNEVVQRVQVGGGGGPVREGYKVVALLLKPSLDLWAGTESCCHTQGLPPATWLHQGITTFFSTSRYTLVLTFKPTSKMWGGMMWPSLETTPKTITVAGNFVFMTQFNDQTVLFPTIFTNPSARAGYDTRPIFKRGLTGLNSEFSF